MAWIETTDAESAGGVRKLLARGIERFHGGFLPGIYRILLVDLQLLGAMGWLFKHLHLGDGSSLSTMQKEMLATVVNGTIDGAP
ncbi:MAG: hypothetical protein Q8W44_12505 [Candidatus Palauibacterales bacterium]|nr:hypothetical protein [Candidatus Palauibacterales bacterium]